MQEEKKQKKRNPHLPRYKINKPFLFLRTIPLLLTYATTTSSYPNIVSKPNIPPHSQAEIYPTNIKADSHTIPYNNHKVYIS